VLCLRDGRFAVSGTWSDFTGGGGAMQIVAQRTVDSGLLYFYGPNNWEILVKVLNACGQNDRYWVFGAASTTLEYTLTVRDTESGAVKSYFNPLGRPSPAIADTDAFATCP
jgi:hypothetical protein